MVAGLLRDAAFRLRKEEVINLWLSIEGQYVNCAGEKAKSYS
jgi:hypothetical protein